MVNECAGLGPGDWMYWVIGCWALPMVGRLLVPVAIASVAMVAASMRRRIA